MAADELSIEMLPARQGDALWVEWGDAGDRHRMLIDGGTAATFKLLRERFLELDPGDRRVDLMVVTHIDLDHIDGAIRLLKDGDLGIPFDDVWFNDYRHVSDGAVTRGAMQGEFLGAVLHERQLPWNEAFGGKAVVVPDAGSLPSVRLPGDLRLVLLSPTPEKLRKLESKWEKVIEEAGMEPGDRVEALARLEDRVGPVVRGGDRTTFGGDGSEANGSSIAFIAEYRGRRWLFAGDAHDDALLDGLRRYGKEVGETPVRLEGFKLPHHGSTRNITPELLDAIDCRKFYVSTDGSYFKHPDRACIDLIVMAADRPELIFNYRSEFNEKWAESAPEYDATFPVGSDEPADGAARRDATAIEHASEPDDSTPEVDATPDADATAGHAVDPSSGSPADASGEEDVTTGGSSGVVDGSGSHTSAPAGPLEVTVFHGSLERADHPVLVGHYAATPLSGAEGFVDRRFQGRLSDRYVRGNYPSDIGQSLLVRAVRRRHPRAGVMVVGLGEYGELTPLRLVATIRQALVSYAFDEADRRESTTPVQYRCRRCDAVVADDARPDHSATDHDGDRPNVGAGVDDTGDDDGYERVPFQLGISSVLLGATGDQGLSVSASVGAILTAVREANFELRTETTAVRAQFTTLQFWERSAAEAELAFRALGVFRDEATSDGDAVVSDGGIREMGAVDATSELKVAAGALESGLRSDDDDQVWWRVRVSELGRSNDTDGAEAPPYLHLEFAVGGRLARTGHVVHLVERRRLERLLREMVSQAQPPPETHIALFELLFPKQLKWDMKAAQDIQLEVDDMTADIPWEMLAARNPREGKRGNLALRAPMVRQLKLKDFPAVQRASEPRALVIGNPPAGRLGPPLQGAYDEAKAVRDVLRGHRFQLTEKLFDTKQRASDQSATEIEQALFANDYRIIHIAAHGLFQPDDPTRTGVVIGPDDFITAQLFDQLNVTPDLVFLNCCHLAGVAMGVESGAIEFTHQNLNRLGASLARRLINSGVRAVVVAGWAVEDGAAEAFATTFYTEMLEGTAFGRAVHAARRAAWESAKDHSTWGAYQCYGDGGYRLPRDVADASTGRKSSAPITRSEALRWVEAIVNRVESVGPDVDSEREIAELGLIESTARAKWIGGGDGRPVKDGRLCEALGSAWAALGEYERAIRCFDEALGARDGAMTLRGLERAVNYKDRRAAELLRGPAAGEADRRRAAALTEEASGAIELLGQLSRSTARMAALRAGHHKRRATALKGDERAESLREAAAAYREAWMESQESYGLCNYVQLEEIRCRVDGTPSEAADLYDQIDDVGDMDVVASASGYWDAVGPADALLTLAIMGDKVPVHADELQQRYEIAFDSGSTAGERASTLDHLWDLAELHPDERQSAALSSVHVKLTSTTS